MQDIKSPALPPTLSTDQVAEVLGYKGRRTIYRLVHAGQLRPLPFPKRPLHFRTEQVLALRDGTASPRIFG
jgi:excisionase family DNA binding protein